MLMNHWMDQCAGILLMNYCSYKDNTVSLATGSTLHLACIIVLQWSI